MAELAQRLCLDLSDTLSGNVKFLADFFKSPGSSVVETESESEHFLLSLCQCSQDFLELFTKKSKSGGVSRNRHVVILDKIAEMAVFLFADRRLK